MGGVSIWRKSDLFRNVEFDLFEEYLEGIF